MLIFKYQVTKTELYELRIYDNFCSVKHTNGKDNYIEWLSRTASQVNEKLRQGIKPDRILIKLTKDKAGIPTLSTKIIKSKDSLDITKFVVLEDNSIIKKVADKWEPVVLTKEVKKLVKQLGKLL